jgi:hypothetical protein
MPDLKGKGGTSFSILPAKPVARSDNPKVYCRPVLQFPFPKFWRLAHHADVVVAKHDLPQLSLPRKTKIREGS